MATHSSVLAWRIPWTDDRRATGHGVEKELDTTEHACKRQRFAKCLAILHLGLTTLQSENIIAGLEAGTPGSWGPVSSPASQLPSQAALACLNPHSGPFPCPTLPTNQLPNSDYTHL